MSMNEIGINFMHILIQEFGILPPKKLLGMTVTGKK